MLGGTICGKLMTSSRQNTHDMGRLLPEAANHARAAAPYAARDAVADHRVITRFAPSPNGALHIGHAYAAIAAHDFARAAGGAFLLRIEDIDGQRSRAEHIEMILADLNWLGLTCDAVIYQSDRIDKYAKALEQLRAAGLIYRCICTRSDIAAALKHRPVRHGPDGPQYPGTCRDRAIDPSLPYCWRLDMAAACEMTEHMTWQDMEAGVQDADPAIFGDVVLWRKDSPASYHLAATVDDSADNITHVVRGRDLFAYTGLHRLIQQLLALQEPVYWHHRLIRDGDGEKLSKRRKSGALQKMRGEGMDGMALAASLRRGELPLGMSR